MGNEATKTKIFHQDKILPFLQGEGIDIGCGNDPVAPNAMPFDQVHGDANKISQYVQKQFDFVFSSHSLEHMHDPKSVIKEWYKLVKPGGYMITIVPDEDLYEQGMYPFRLNTDHKYSFTISKSKSWSPKSINVLDLIKDLKADIVLLEQQEDNYDRSYYIHNPGPWNFFMGRMCNKFRRLAKPFGLEMFVCWLMNRMGAVVDQTGFPDTRLAQIMFVVRKV